MVIKDAEGRLRTGAPSYVRDAFVPRKNPTFEFENIHCVTRAKRVVFSIV